jgi:hypothetical protein
MKRNEMGVRVKCVFPVLLGSHKGRRYSTGGPPGSLCVWPRYVQKDLKKQRANNVRRCEDIIKIDVKQVGRVWIG